MQVNKKLLFVFAIAFSLTLAAGGLLAAPANAQGANSAPVNHASTTPHTT
jgi:hypothetical protein